MRRFSQRSALVTLSEINITPLLDLAFVLLIIFIITTPLLEKGLQLTLPKGGESDKQINPRDVRTVEITTKGEYVLHGTRMKLESVVANLVKDFKSNPNLVVYIRADEMGFNRDSYALIDQCQRNGITRYSLRTNAQNRR